MRFSHLTSILFPTHSYSLSHRAKRIFSRKYEGKQKHREGDKEEEQIEKRG